MSSKLYAMSLGSLGNIAKAANDFGWSDFLVTADNGTALFRFPSDWPWDDKGPLTHKMKTALLVENIAQVTQHLYQGNHEHRK